MRSSGKNAASRRPIHVPIGSRVFGSGIGPSSGSRHKTARSAKRTGGAQPRNEIAKSRTCFILRLRGRGEEELPAVAAAESVGALHAQVELRLGAHAQPAA